MKYTFTIQPDPVRITGVEAENDVDAEAYVRQMLDERRDDFVKIFLTSKWHLALARECSETILAEKEE